MNFYHQFEMVLLVLAHHSAFSLTLKVNYIDYCDYRGNHYYQCGDICLRYITSPFNGTYSDKCTCGYEEILDFSYCCISPMDSCMENEKGAECPNGKMLEPYEMCHGRCYNDYMTSRYLGVYTQFSCPDKCVEWRDMCQGVSFCDGDQEVCGEDLRCDIKPNGNKFGAIDLIVLIKIHIQI